MILYNVTVKVENEIAGDWLSWLQDEHIPDVLNTGCFMNATILQLEEEEAEGKTYAIQYLAKDREQVDTYLERFSADMRARGTERWGQRFIAFRSILKVINRM